MRSRAHSRARDRERETDMLRGPSFSCGCGTSAFPGGEFGHTYIQSPICRIYIPSVGVLVPETILLLCCKPRDHQLKRAIDSRIVIDPHQRACNRSATHSSSAFRNITAGVRVYTCMRLCACPWDSVKAHVKQSNNTIRFIDHLTIFRTNNKTRNGLHE